VRSLGRAGHIVHVCASTAQSLAGRSRYAVSHTRVPDALREPVHFAREVLRLVESVNARILVPVTEASLIALLEADAPIHECIMPVPSLEQFSAISDKQHILEAAARHGIAVPRQMVAVGPVTPIGAAGNLTFPVVLKPARSVSGPTTHRHKASVSYAATEQELEVALAAMSPDAFPVLLQERIVGPGFAISVLLWNRRLHAAFAHRRLREKPPSGGVSVLRESMPLDQALLDRSVALLREFDWSGVAMVEFKLDARTNTPYLMEINGRLWGSLQLAIDAGVDFPVLLLRAALGEDPPSTLDYTVDTRTRWELGDVDHLIAVLRRSRASLNLPPGFPGRLKTFGAFLRSFGPGTRAEVFQRDDPFPFVREVASWLRLP
jgi:predicted ATP-grasp superfamily ATP-dependent carboligase